MCKLTVPWEGTGAGSKQVEEGAAEAWDWAGWAAPSRSPQFPVPKPSPKQGWSNLRPPRACLQVAEQGSWGPARRPRPPTATPPPPFPGSFAVMNDFPQPLSWELRG